MRLDQYSVGDYSPGAPFWQQLLWYFIGSPLLRSYLLPMSGFKVLILRLFGAQIGQGVRIKTGVRVKFPWRLTIGDHVWLGEDVWIDNLAPIRIGDHVCISQSVYLCTGNHDWNHPGFALRTGEIIIESKSWLAAKSIVGPGVTIKQGSILTLGSVTVQSLEPMTIYSGNPAVAVKTRKQSLLEAENNVVS